MKIKAFTLTELLIALAVLGLLIAVLMPIVSNILPDQNALMAKRTFYAIQTIVSDMMNDEACYPDHRQSIYDDQRVGFDDGYGYADCLKWGGAENEESIETEDSATKFATLFSSKLDKDDDEIGSFETRDGVKWVITPDFTANSATSYARISVDVNGDENPNCSQSGNADETIATGQEACAQRTSDFDIYSVQVFADGKIVIEDDWAKNAVKLKKNITGDDQ